MHRSLGIFVLCGVLFPSLASAEPTRCDAVFVGPAEGCSLTGEWAVAATAKSAAKARKLVLQRLGSTIQVGAELQAVRVAGTMAAMTADEELKTCRTAALEAAYVSCVEEPSLADSQICIADLSDNDCYDGLPIDLVGVAWKVSEQGRAALCSSVDARLVARGATSQQRQVCEIACARASTVRCVAR